MFTRLITVFVLMVCLVGCAEIPDDRSINQIDLTLIPCDPDASLTDDCYAGVHRNCDFDLVSAECVDSGEIGCYMIGPCYGQDFVVWISVESDCCYEQN